MGMSGLGSCSTSRLRQMVLLTRELRSFPQEKRILRQRNTLYHEREEWSCEKDEQGIGKRVCNIAQIDDDNDDDRSSGPPDG